MLTTTLSGAVWNTQHNDGGDGSLPDIRAVELRWAASPGGVRFHYSTVGSFDAATTISLYWATGFTADTKIGDPIFSHSITADAPSGLHGPIDAVVDASTEPVGATHLVLVADAGGLVTEFNETNNTQSLELADLSALDSASNATGGFHWNSVAAGGGFTFSYEVANPSDQPLDSEIVFRWNGESETPAYRFAIHPSSVDSAGLPATAPGTHRVIVTQSEFVAYQSAATDGSTASPPRAIALSGPPDTLALQIDPPDNGQPNGSVPESNQADNTAVLEVVPLVVDVVSHGFNPFGFSSNSAEFLAPFRAIGGTLQAMPVPASTLDNRVSSYVADWDSTTAFLGGFLSLLTAKAVFADVELLRSSDPPADALANQLELVADTLRQGAAASAIYSDALLWVAATQIVDRLASVAYLLPPAESNALQQRILLIGHSRGAGLNALVEQLLVLRDGYDQNHIDYIALDGYGSDWTDDGGILSLVDVGQESQYASERTNYRAAQGLAFDPTVLGLLSDLLPDELLQQVQLDTQDSLLAPVRDGFTKNATLPDAPPDPDFPGGSFHTTIHTSYAKGVVAIGDSRPAIEDNYIYEHSLDGLSGVASQVPSTPSPQATGTLNIPTGFVDGDLAVLGQLDSVIRALPLVSTGYDQLDQLVQALIDPAQLVGRYWQVTGNVEVAHGASGSVLRLDRLVGDASVGQTMLLPEHLQAVEFDLGVQNAGPTDRLEVRLDGVLLQALPLNTLPGQSRIAIPLSGVTASHGTLTFRLHSTANHAVVATLGNFSLSSFETTRVEAAQLFYNNSKFDGGNTEASADDAAIATDKAPLLPGGTATFANYSSYSRGINGLIIDIAGASHTPTVDDFEFRVGTTGSPNSWSLAPATSSFSVRADAGVHETDRVTITWPDGAIMNQWLSIRVGTSLGLAEPQLYFFGNAVGDSGDTAGSAIVNATDEIGARQHPHSFLNPATVTDPYDFNRDGLVNATDQILSRRGSTTLATALKLIDVHNLARPASPNEPRIPLADDKIVVGLAAPRIAWETMSAMGLVEATAEIPPASFAPLPANPVRRQLPSAPLAGHDLAVAPALEFDEQLYELIAADLVACRL